MKNKLKEMLVLQDKLNTDTNWENWKLWITNKGKIINWKRCIYMELAEAIDSVSWKHWKNVEWGIDYQNFKIELVDIWHFLMSELIVQIRDTEELAEFIEKNSDYKSKIKLPLEWKIENNSELDDIIEPYENLMALSLLKINDKDYLSDFIKAFFIAIDSASLDFDELYDLYIWKNVLNKFRQDHGYKEWTYIKVWNWEEDNVVMQRILKDTKWFSDIYNELKKIYITLK